jgi:hypothetical protein
MCKPCTLFGPTFNELVQLAFIPPASPQSAQDATDTVHEKQNRTFSQLKPMTRGPWQTQFNQRKFARKIKDPFLVVVYQATIIKTRR